MSFLLGVIIFVLALLISVMLHESGHFVMAKKFRMKVTQFFVGFGPTLWSRQRGETEYGVKALPLGGFVKIVGMTALEEIDPADEPRAFRRQPGWQRMIVLAAGSFMHFVLAFVLLFDPGGGHRGAATARPSARSASACPGRSRNWTPAPAPRARRRPRPGGPGSGPATRSSPSRATRSATGPSSATSSEAAGREARRGRGRPRRPAPGPVGHARHGQRRGRLLPRHRGPALRSRRPGQRRGLRGLHLRRDRRGVRAGGRRSSPRPCPTCSNQTGPRPPGATSAASWAPPMTPGRSSRPAAAGSPPSPRSC